MTDGQDALQPPDSEKGSVRALAAVRPFVRPHKKILAGTVVALCFTAAVALTLPLAFRHIIDGFNDSDTGIQNRYFALAILAVGLLAIGSSVRNYLTKLLGELIALDIRKTVFSRMIRMSPAYFEHNMTGEILTRITADTTLIQLFVGNSLSMAMRHSVMLAGGLSLLFFTSPKLMGLAILVVPLVMGPIIAVGRRVRANAQASQNWLATSSANASESLFSTQTIQAYSAEAHATSSFNAVTDQALNAARRMVRSHALMNGIVITLVFFGMVAVIWVGAQEVRAQRISIGELVQFTLYCVIVATSVAAFSDVWGEVQRASGAAERLIEVLNAQDTISDVDTPVSLGANPLGRVAFEGVVFSYPARPEAQALNASFEAPPGQVVALVGPSGAGKSTVLQLLLRFYDPAQGQITIDGKDIRQMHRQELRRHIAIVQQEAMIFATDVRENIRFGRPDASDAEVEAAAKAASAHDFISALPEAYGTFVGERGTMLSGGQKQRISIARAILKDAPILLLDEATSALDSESERAIQDAVQKLSDGRTTLIVAHRLSTVQQADKILVFEAGQVVAQGTHDQLIAEDGLYARYSRLQLI